MTMGRASRRRFLIGAVGLLGLAGCDYFNSPGNIAFANGAGYGGYAIDMQRGFSRPVKPDDVAVFKRNAPQEWDRVRDPALVQRLVDDFNANPGRWVELSPYEEHLLWTPPAELPLM